jgi:glutathione-regulated potassium-efflux system ancillary protein KefF
MDELTTASAAPDILVLAAHPNWRESRVNRQLVAAARRVRRVVVHDLYAKYPDYDIDVPTEQALLAAAKLVVWLHPIQWYSMPPLQKLWLDEVLQYGWAYGPGGEALLGKDLWLAVTTGGSEASYHPQGYNRHFFDAFLPPYEQTAALCGLRFLPPLVLHGARAAADDDVAAHVEVFENRLRTYPAWPELEDLPACVACDVPRSDRPAATQPLAAQEAA